MSLTKIVKPGAKKFSLSSVDPNDTGPFDGRNDPEAQKTLDRAIEKMLDLQQKLYAESKQSLLVILQAMDTGGKDGTIRSVIGPLDSRGCHVVSFKPPNAEEAAHDFLWRCHKSTPRQGEIVVFNRSHYEDVLVVRVLGLQPKSVWQPRYEQINNFEKLLAETGTRIVKLYLHISKDEQKKRLQERLSDHKKLWKFDRSDIEMRAHWDDFQQAYETALVECSTKWAPWHVVPANKKWFRNIAVAQTIADALENLDPKYPEPKIDPREFKLD